jgi:hypothetical protein
MNKKELEAFEITGEDITQLNTVVTTNSDTIPAGHNYTIQFPNEKTVDINFILGGRNTEGCVPGIYDSDLLRILIDRTQMWVDKYPMDKFNIETLKHLKLALDSIKVRTEDRLQKGTLGNNGEDYMQHNTD